MHLLMHLMGVNNETADRWERISNSMKKQELGELILSSQDCLYRVAKSFLYSDADCCDAIHETIVCAFEKLHTLKNDQFAKTWLVRILINECCTVLRKQKKLIPLETLPETIPYESPEYTDLYLAISKLPRDLRTAIVLYYVEGFSVKEVASIEQTTESAIKNRLMTARRKLRSILQEEEEQSV